MTIKESTEENFDGIFEIVFAPAVGSTLQCFNNPPSVMDEHHLEECRGFGMKLKWKKRHGQAVLEFADFTYLALENDTAT